MGDVTGTTEPEGGGLILVVDDNAVNRMVLTKALEALGHTVMQAEQGQKAIEILRDPRRRFDVVLLDLLMPDMDGYEALAAIRADEGNRDLPVIVISAVDDVASATRCVELGASDYLTKPVNPSLLKARLEASLAQQRLRDLRERLRALADAAGGGRPVEDMARVLRELARATEPGVRAESR